ncbi:hypothetical protein K3495_g10128 [Podosphaera aphanis]|nr:hypothetical protein K3495_g10128 [Podosphaera aphanis]
MASNLSIDTDTNKDGNLRSVLSSDEQRELILLVENITLVMKKQIFEIFNVETKAKKKPPQVKSSDDSEKSMRGSLDEADKSEKLPKYHEKPLKNQSAQEIRKLKQDYLDYFDKWKDSIISRISTEVEDSEDVISKVLEKAPSKGVLTTNDNPEVKVILPTTDIVEADAKLIELYPPVSTSLCALPHQKRLLILHVTLLMLISLKQYSAQSRVLLFYISSSLHLPLRILVEDELEIARSLLVAAKEMSASEEMQKRSDMNKFSRAWKVGLAGIAGATIIGITGGLAAPLVAGAVGTVMGGLGLGASAAAGLLGSIAESSVVVGSLFGAYGARMTSNSIDSYAKSVRDFAFLPLKSSITPTSSLENRRLRLTIGVSGWLSRNEDIITPWRVLGQSSEVFALQWEVEALSVFGNSMESIVETAAWNIVSKEIISRTMLATVSEAFWPLSLLKFAKLVDNPFSVSMSRADKAGVILADAIINKVQGERPITLIGYSVGARLIYSCLLSLSKRRTFGLIENVVLMGAPIPSQELAWCSMRSVVSGRLVNVYSTNDYILAFLYRAASAQYGVAGIQKINDVKRVENIDVSEIVSGHLRYKFVVGTILKKIGWESVDMEEVTK